MESLGQDAKGHPCIVDFDVAKREWAANTSRPVAIDSSVDGAEPPVVTTPHDEAPFVSTKDLDLSPLSRLSLADAQRAVAIERARKLRLENDLAAALKVDVATVKKQNFESARIIREGMQNISARIAAAIAAETDPAAVARKLDAAIREALNITADALLASVNT